MAELEDVEGAILRASRPGELGAFAQTCGVFGPDRQHLRLAATIAPPVRISLRAPCPDPETLRRGRWLFGGIGFHHFGHALIFSTARLWALDHLQGGLDGVLFFDRGTAGSTRPGTSRNLEAILALLGIDLPVVTIGADERVERLVVPAQGISTDAEGCTGTERYRAFIRQRLGPAPGEEPGDRLYVSRANLGVTKAGLLFEDRIQALMATAGFTIFHPQRASLADQVARYRNAAWIVGVDGSALHLAAFAASARARIAILGRRPHYPEALASQARAFSGAEALVLRPPGQLFRLRDHVEASDAWTGSYSLPDFPTLSHLLTEAGALPPGTPPWPPPSEAEVAARLARIARRTGRELTANT